MANIQVTGIDQMIRRLNQLGTGASRAENKALHAGADVLKATMERNAPGPSNKTGRPHLRDNIVKGRIRTQKGEKFIQVGPGKQTFWSVFLEFGTTKMAPQPFVERSVDEAGQQVLRVMARTLRDELRL